MTRKDETINILLNKITILFKDFDCALKSRRCRRWSNKIFNTFWQIFEKREVGRASFATALKLKFTEEKLLTLFTRKDGKVRSKIFKIMKEEVNK